MTIPLEFLLIWPIAGFVAEGDDTEAESATVDDPAVAVTTPSPSSTTDEGLARPSRGDDDRWIHRWAPERNMGELGAFAGVFYTGSRHELFEPSMDLPDQGFKEFADVAPEIGGRAGFYPGRYYGFEAEGGAVPTETTDAQRATLWNVRGSVVGQLGRWSITPFALVGVGAFGVSSSRAAVGNDVDPSVHFGGGVKMYLSRTTQIRLDVRDVVGNQRGVELGFRDHNLEALLGVSMTLGRSRPAEPEPVDTDGDGFFDPDDQCVNEPGIAPSGCPVRDTDGDGFLDTEDSCVTEVGVAPDGCPMVDTDGDGLFDPDDQCVDEAGPAPSGCPVLDTDGDGLFDPDDQCIEQPETANGFEDGDGCPDELPEALAEFSGVIEGIRFQTNKARILPRSLPRLKKAAAVMKDFPDIRLEISGHTDAVGGRKHNLDLSRRRAEAVRDFLVAQGIDASRLETRGVGPDRPIASNDDKRGRSLNRRIEFKVLGTNTNVSGDAQ
ncbi:MAG: OmpA family protein [Myxococcota bacterium]